MTKEKRPGLDLSLAVPPPKTFIERYQETSDPDEKAKMVNQQIDRDERGVVTAESVRMLSAIAAAEASAVTQYRPDAIAGLNASNLVAVANRLVQEAEEDKTVVEAGIEQIIRAEERATTGLTPGFKEDGMKDDKTAILRYEIFLELAERLGNPADIEDHRQVIGAIDGLMTRELLQEIRRNYPDLYLILEDNAHSFSNNALRETLLHRRKR